MEQYNTEIKNENGETVNIESVVIPLNPEAQAHEQQETSDTKEALEAQYLELQKKVLADGISDNEMKNLQEEMNVIEEQIAMLESVTKKAA